MEEEKGTGLSPTLTGPVDDIPRSGSTRSGYRLHHQQPSNPIVPSDRYPIWCKLVHTFEHIAVLLACFGTDFPEDRVALTYSEKMRVKRLINLMLSHARILGSQILSNVSFQAKALPERTSQRQALLENHAIAYYHFMALPLPW